MGNDDRKMNLNDRFAELESRQKQLERTNEEQAAQLERLKSTGGEIQRTGGSHFSIPKTAVDRFLASTPLRTDFYCLGTPFFALQLVEDKFGSVDPTTNKRQITPALWMRMEQYFGPGSEFTDEDSVWDSKRAFIGHWSALREAMVTVTEADKKKYQLPEKTPLRSGLYSMEQIIQAVEQSVSFVRGEIISAMEFQARMAAKYQEQRAIARIHSDLNDSIEGLTRNRMKSGGAVAVESDGE